MSSVIRLAAAQDLDVLVILMRAADTERGLDVVEEAAAAALTGGSERATFFGWAAADAEGRPPDGYLEVERRVGVPGLGRGSSGLLGGLFVGPRAREQGLELALLDAAAAWAASRGCVSIVRLVEEPQSREDSDPDEFGFAPPRRFSLQVRALTARDATLSLPSTAGAVESRAAPVGEVGAPGGARPWGAWGAHGAVGVIGLYAVTSTDVWSADLWSGAAAPVVAVAAGVYFVGLFIARRYARRTRAQARVGELFGADRDR